MNRTTRIFVGSIALGLAVLAQGACHRGAPQSDSAPSVKMGLYRAALTLPGGELPFGLDLEPDGTATVGHLINGKERLKLDEVAGPATGEHYTQFVDDVRATLDQLVAES